MANVTLSDVRDTINLSETDISDNKLQKMVNRAQTALSLELKKTLNASDCTDAEKEAIILLSAIYAICYLTSGSAVGLNYSIGDQNLSVAERAPPMILLQEQLDHLLGNLKPKVLRSA